MFSTEITCTSCGGVDFDLDSGQYICRSCYTQSQDIEEQSFEFKDCIGVPVGNEEKEEFVSQKIDAVPKCTSWESYNIILRGLVDELVNLGAKKELRKTVFRLWALLLHKENIAFFSTEEEDKLPTFTTNFKNQDVEILYGIKRFRQFYLKNLTKSLRRVKQSEESSSETSEEFDESELDTSRKSVRSLRQKQRKLAMSVLECDSSQNEESSIIFPESLNRIDAQNKMKATKQVASSAVKRMNEAYKRFEFVKRKYHNEFEKIPRNVKSLLTDRIYGRSDRKLTKNITSNQPIKIQFSISLLLAILRLALLLIEDSIQWTDLFRWSCEGHLSSFRIAKYLPENAHIRHTDVLPTSRTYLNTHEIRKLTVVLNIREIPTPDIFALIERYSFELCLPNEFVEFTKRVVAMFPPRMDYSEFQYRVFPDYECRAVGYILFVFKLLFSLDDVTEMKQSEFADTVNRCDENTFIKERLFSWTDWIRYIECRKAVLCKHDVTMNKLYEKGTSTTDNAFLEFWMNSEADTEEGVSCKSINKSLVNELQTVATRFQNKHVKEEVNTVIFPPSMTPFRTYTQHLIDNHRELLSDRCHRILSTDFGSHSIRYLLDPEWAMDIGTQLHLNVSAVPKTAVKMKEYEEPKPKNVPKRLSQQKAIPAHIPLTVRIHDDCIQETEGNQQIRKINKSRKTKKIEETEGIEEIKEVEEIQETKEIQEAPKEKKEGIQAFSPVFKCFDENSNEGRKDKSNFKLHYPASRYWFLHGLIPKTCGEKFTKEARRHFSASFLYVLQECSRIIRCDPHNLNEELANIEFAYACLFGDDYEYSGEARFVVLPNEW